MKRAKRFWWCKKHEFIEVVVPKYKVIVRVIDDTGSAPLLLFDDMINTLVNQIVTDYFHQLKATIHNLPLHMFIAASVASDPTKYSKTVLWKLNEEYCAWVLNPKNWGGIFLMPCVLYSCRQPLVIGIS